MPSDTDEKIRRDGLDDRTFYSRRLLLLLGVLIVSAAFYAALTQPKASGGAPKIAGTIGTMSVAPKEVRVGVEEEEKDEVKAEEEEDEKTPDELQMEDE